MITDTSMSAKSDVIQKETDCGCGSAEEVGALIPLEKAARWTRLYREKNPGQIRGHFFGKNIIHDILNKPRAAGIRIYYGIDDKAESSAWDQFLTTLINFLQRLKSDRVERRQLLLVPADENYTDLIKDRDTKNEQKSFEDIEMKAVVFAKALPDDEVGDSSLPCPNGCGGGNSLNGM